MFHFDSTCFEWESLICPVTTQLLKECISSRIGLPTYTPVQQSTFLHLLRLLRYIPGGFPALLSLTAFCTFRCFLRHVSAYTSCHWQRASHPSQILRNGALFKVKSDTFFFCFLLVEHTQTHTHAGSALWLGRKRCLSGCDLLGFSGVWSAANDNWVNLIKTGDLSPSDCFPRRAILRMLKWWEHRGVRECLHTSFTVDTCWVCSLCP